MVKLVDLSKKNWLLYILLLFQKLVKITYIVEYICIIGNTTSSSSICVLHSVFLISNQCYSGMSIDGLMVYRSRNQLKFQLQSMLNTWWIGLNLSWMMSPYSLKDLVKNELWFYSSNVFTSFIKSRLNWLPCDIFACFSAIIICGLPYCIIFYVPLFRCTISSQLQRSCEDNIQTPFPGICTYLPLSFSEDCVSEGGGPS